MVSGQGILVGSFIVLLSLPMLLTPRRAARFRHRHARDPEPTDAAVRDARLTGSLIFATGVFVFFAY